jgi:hypothetical protein
MSGLSLRASLRRHRFHHSAIKEVLMEKIKIFTVAHVPPALQQAWLQHLRDFDTAHPGCHFEVGIDGPEVTLEEMVDRLQVNPGLTFHEIFDRTKWSKP